MEKFNERRVEEKKDGRPWARGVGMGKGARTAKNEEREAKVRGEEREGKSKTFGFKA